MTVVAFTYDDYYCWSPRSNFRGRFEDEKEVLSILRGGAYNKQNLEIMDLETLGWVSYRWDPMYKLHSEYEPKSDGHYEFDVNGRMVEAKAWLTHHNSNDNAPIINLKWMGSGSGYAVLHADGSLDCGRGSRLIEAGTWHRKNA